MGHVDELIERTHGAPAADPTASLGSGGADAQPPAQPAPADQERERERERRPSGELRRRLPPYNDLYDGVAVRLDVDYDGLGFVFSAFGLLARILGVI